MDREALSNRRFYRCSYCNAVFLQVDAWQRHNRKHTGLEIECDDCGSACANHMELIEHQRQCTSNRVYSHASSSFASHPEYARRISAKLLGASEFVANANRSEARDQAPDSTSRSENTANNDVDSPVASNVLNVPVIREDFLSDLSKGVRSGSNEANPSEFAGGRSDSTIIERCRTSHSVVNENVAGGGDRLMSIEDEAIGIDGETLASVAEDGSENDADSQDSDRDHQIASRLYNTENPSALSKHDRGYTFEDDRALSPGQDLSLPTAELIDGRYRFRPYFCKCCGARFTRKDSVTRHLNKGTCRARGVIVCNICGRAYASPYELYDHVKEVHKTISIKPPPLPAQGRSYGSEGQSKMLSSPLQNAGERRNVESIQALNLSPIASGASGYLPDLPDASVPENNQAKTSPAARQQSEGLASERYLLTASANRLANEALKGGSCRSRNLSYDAPSGSCLDRSDAAGFDVKAINQSNISSNSKRFLQNVTHIDNSVHDKTLCGDEPGRAHACNVCGLDFPKFEYLLTHLRKHKEKSDVERPVKEHCREAASFPSISAAWSISGVRTDAPLPAVLSPAQGEVLKPSFSTAGESHFNRDICQSQGTTATKCTPSQGLDDSRAAKMPPGGLLASVVSPELDHEDVKPLDIASGCRPDGLVIQGTFFRCEICRQEFRAKELLVKHVRLQQCVEQRRDYKCEVCSKVFLHDRSLVQHKDIVHGEGSQCTAPVRIENEEDLGYELEMAERCEQESKGVSCTSYPRVSVEKASATDGRNDSAAQDPKMPCNSMLPRPFNCQYCGDRFAHRHSLRRHVRRHLGIGIPCKECGKLYRDQSEWRRHQRNFHRRIVPSRDAPPCVTVSEKNLCSLEVVETSGYHDKVAELSDLGVLDDDSASDGDSDVGMEVDVSKPKSDSSAISSGSSGEFCATTEGMHSAENQSCAAVGDISGTTSENAWNKQTRKFVLDSYLGAYDDDNLTRSQGVREVKQKFFGDIDTSENGNSTPT